MLPDSPFLKALVRHFQPGEVILAENGHNDCLFVILDGVVNQVKKGEQNDTRIDRQGSGDFIGLLSFQTGEPVFTTATAQTKVTVLAINHDQFDELIHKFPQVSNTLQGLIFSNLSDRYRRVVGLHVEVDQLTQELKKEKQQLKKTIGELEQTRNMLISQEKMAVLGELTAGLAHEMNNPASALLRSVDFLITYLPGMLQKASHLKDSGLVPFFFEQGQKRIFRSSMEQRTRMTELAKTFPGLKRTQVRVLADMEQEALDEIAPFARNEHQTELFSLFLEAFQAGIFLHGIQLSAGRIEHLVKSLKSFSRQSNGQKEVIDIRSGIMETLQILGSQLKNVNVEVDLPEIPPVSCHPGEINQVWTNLIINAIDAMESRGKLFVSCGMESHERVWVRVADNGPGVPDKVKKKIFDSSFTTKTAGGEFGLGLGLAISKGIIEKHQGTIQVQDRPGGGAQFVVLLPVAGENAE